MYRLVTIATAIAMCYSLAAFSEEIKIAVVGSSPYFPNIQEELMEGAQSAINTSSTHIRFPISTTYYDDGCAIELAAAYVEQMSNENISFVIGHPCSHAAVVASQLYEAYGMVFIAIGASHPGLTEGGLNSTFRLGISTDTEGMWAARLFARNSDAKTIAILYSDNATSRLRAEAFAAEWNSNSRSVVYPNSFSMSSLVPTPENAIQDLRNVSADAIYLAYSTEEEIVKFIDMSESMFSNTSILASSVIAGSLFDVLERHRSRDVFLSIPVEPQMHESAQTAIQEVASMGVEPSYFALHAYAAVEAVQSAIASTGTINPRTNAQWLKKNPIPSIFGTISFLPNGDNEVTPVALYGPDGTTGVLLDVSHYVKCPAGTQNWKD